MIPGESPKNQPSIPNPDPESNQRADPGDFVPVSSARSRWVPVDIATPHGQESPDADGGGKPAPGPAGPGCDGCGGPGGRRIGRGMDSLRQRHPRPGARPHPRAPRFSSPTRFSSSSRWRSHSTSTVRESWRTRDYVLARMAALGVSLAVGPRRRAPTWCSHGVSVVVCSPDAVARPPAADRSAAVVAQDRVDAVPSTSDRHRRRSDRRCADGGPRAPAGTVIRDRAPLPRPNGNDQADPTEHDLSEIDLVIVAQLDDDEIAESSRPSISRAPPSSTRRGPCLSHREDPGPPGRLAVVHRHRGFFVPCNHGLPPRPAIPGRRRRDSAS